MGTRSVRRIAFPASALRGRRLDPATSFTVLWGPEDGRWLVPAAGDTVGRWHQRGEDQHQLYATCPVIDGALRRGHLRFLGAGQVELLHDASWVARGAGWRQATQARGNLALRGGDLLMLGGGTWLLGLAG